MAERLMCKVEHCEYRALRWSKYGYCAMHMQRYYRAMRKKKEGPPVSGPVDVGPAQSKRTKSGQPIGCMVPPELRATLMQLAGEAGVPLSRVVHEALVCYVEEVTSATEE